MKVAKILVCGVCVWPLGFPAPGCFGIHRLSLSKMNQFPVFLTMRDRRVVILGGGEAALAKARLVIAAGGAPALVWPEIEPATRAGLSQDAERPAAKLIEAAPARADLAGAALVFIAIDDAHEAARWARIAKSQGALVNVVDRPELCDFLTPAIVDRGTLTVAISTGGSGPVFAKEIREKVEALLPVRTNALLALAARYRETVRAKIAAPARRKFWEKFFRGPIAERALAGDEAGANELALAAVNNPDTEQQTGLVHIIGAGPGDPELLTLRALRLIQEADVILYDRLVSADILNLARRDAERVYVGKAKANHAVPQDEIEVRMIAYAREGKIVARLKGGDPFIFGRGGEELDALRAAGVEAFVTPGITAATGCAAATGMALTHRDDAQAVTFVTGHAKNDAEPDLDWGALAALKNTLVVYMGVGKAGVIAARLIAHGRAVATPAAVIENGARPEQKIVKGTLGDLGMMVEGAGIKGPALLVIGDVAARADGAGLVDIATQARRAA